MNTSSDHRPRLAQPHAAAPGRAARCEERRGHIGSSTVTGGQDNLAQHTWATVSGGHNRTANDPHDWVAGTLTEDD